MKNSGFTLVETLIAISILVLAVTGAFSAAQSGMTSALHSKDQITAFYLAQEGIEQIRNLRDENGLTGVNWLTNIANPGDPCALGNKCYVDTLNTSNPLTGCFGACPNLKLNVNGFYSYDSGDDTRFRREILVTSVGPNEIKVEATVFWSKGVLVDRSFTATEHLLNWQ